MGCLLVKMGCKLVKLVVQCLCMWNKMDLAISSLFLSFLSHFLWIMDPPRSRSINLTQAPLDQSWQSWALIKGKWCPQLWVTQWGPNKPCRGRSSQNKTQKWGLFGQFRSGKSGYKMVQNRSISVYRVPQYFNGVSQWLKGAYIPFNRSIPYFKQFCSLFCPQMHQIRSGNIK